LETPVQLITTGWLWFSCQLFHFDKSTNQLQLWLYPKGAKDQTQPDFKTLFFSGMLMLEMMESNQCQLQQKGAAGPLIRNLVAGKGKI